jgi:sugar-specific transcriptional regulator TrmB
VTDAIAALVELGFTALEAEVYTWLLGEASAAATGYRIAQGIGKPVANTYKAIESLHKKGAVLVEEEENRLCRAVPAEELLRALERSFGGRRADAARALAGLAQPAGDDRVYTLRTPQQVLERARTMLRGASEIVLLDAFPRALDALARDLGKTVARGPRVAIKAYNSIEIDGADVFVQPGGEQVLTRWGGEWLNIVVDGAEHMLAFLSADLTTVHQAVWSQSPYLSWVYHSALGSELAMAGVQELAADAPHGHALRKLAARADALVAPQAPGFRALMKRFGKE